MSTVSAVRIAGSRFHCREFAALEQARLRTCPALRLPGLDAGDPWTWRVPSGVDLDDWVRPLGGALAALELTERRCVRSVSAVLPCNWKVAIDAHNEALHVGFLHADIAAGVDWRSATFEALGRHGRIRVATARGLTDQWFVFPDVHINSSAGGREVQVLRHVPGEDPRRCTIQMLVLGPPGATGPDAPHRATTLDDPAFGPVTGADLAALADVQAGVEAARFPGLHAGPLEPGVAHFHAVLDALCA